MANLKMQVLDVPAQTDIVIKGLGFIKVTKPGEIKIYLPINVKMSMRKSIIG